MDELVGVLTDDNTITIYDCDGSTVCNIFSPPSNNDFKEMYYSRHTDKLFVLMS